MPKSKKTKIKFSENILSFLSNNENKVIQYQRRPENEEPFGKVTGWIQHLIKVCAMCS